MMLRMFVLLAALLPAASVANNEFNTWYAGTTYTGSVSTQGLKWHCSGGTCKLSGNYGTGLNMAICKELSQKVGGLSYYYNDTGMAWSGKKNRDMLDECNSHTGAPAQSSNVSNSTSVCKVFSSQNPVLFAHVYKAAKGMNLDGCIGYSQQKLSNGKEMTLEGYLDTNTPQMHQALSNHYQEGKRLMMESFPNVEVIDLSGRNCPGAEMYSLTYPSTDISYGVAYLPCHQHLVRVEAHGNLVSQIANMSRQLGAMQTLGRR